MENLKNYDDKIIYFVIFNISLFLLMNYNYEIIIKNFDVISIILSASIVYLPIYLINNLIPRKFKFKLLYFNKPIPTFASDIFTKMKNNKIKYDKKYINLNLIFEKHTPPKTNEEEDNLWYSLYTKHRYNPKIYQQNRDFMLCRDFVSLIMPLTLVFSIIVYFFGVTLKNIIIIIVIAFIEFLIFRYITIKFNEKFALSVLQEETYHIKNEK